MRTYQTRLAVDDDAPLRVYAGVFSRALRSLHASRHSGSALSKPRFMREFGLTSRQYNAVKFSLEGPTASAISLPARTFPSLPPGSRSLRRRPRLASRSRTSSQSRAIGTSRSPSSIWTSAKRKRSCRTPRHAANGGCRRLPTRASPRRSARARTIVESKSLRSALRTARKSVLRNTRAGMA